MLNWSKDWDEIATWIGWESEERGRNSKIMTLERARIADRSQGIEKN